MAADDRSGDLVARWRQGDHQAAAELFQRYADRLIALARSRLSAKLTHRLDPEDIVQSAYRSFFADARDGRYDLQRGGDLWRLLVAITLNKLHDQLRRHTTKKRAVGAEHTFGTEDSLLGIQPNVLAREPSAEEAVALVDEMQRVMERLPALHRRILELRLLGHDAEEIASETQVSRRSVFRVLDAIKEQLVRWGFRNHGA
jgi:RNA polymerase sigma factor (sigma-70 family)